MTSVRSIACVCDGELREAIVLSDRVREETLRRCYAIPSYAGKPLRWKNRYYDLIRSRVIAELAPIWKEGN